MKETARAARVTAANRAPVRPRGRYVLYWMIAARRTRWNHALDHALATAADLGRPLLVLEALRAGYRWASDRFHAFVLQGMADNQRAFEAAGVAYLPYVEPEPGRGAGLLEALAREACAVITDEQPGFFLPRMVAAAAARLDVRLEQVDGNGVLPLRAHERTYATAAAFRRHLQQTALPFLLAPPSARPLARLPRGLRDADVPARVTRRWPAAAASLLGGEVAVLARLPIDHAVAPVAYRGGQAAAGAVLDDFVATKLARYAEDHNQPDLDATSGLSPYLHFGHVSAHEVAMRVLDAGTIRYMSSQATTRKLDMTAYLARWAGVTSSRAEPRRRDRRARS